MKPFSFTVTLAESEDDVARWMQANQALLTLTCESDNRFAAKISMKAVIRADDAQGEHSVHRVVVRRNLQADVAVRLAFETAYEVAPVKMRIKRPGDL